MSTIETLVTIRDSALAKIAEIKALEISDLKGATEERDKHIAELMKQIEWCNEQLAIYDPVEIVTQGYS